MGDRIFAEKGFRGTHEILISKIWAGRIGSAMQFTIGNEYCTIDRYKAVELARAILNEYE